MTKSNITGICFALGYILICLISTDFQTTGSWNMMPWFMYAFPFSCLSIFMAYIFGGSSILFLILNAIWWFFLVKLFFYAKDKSRYIDLDDDQQEN